MRFPLRKSASQATPEPAPVAAPGPIPFPHPPDGSGTWEEVFEQRTGLRLDAPLRGQATASDARAERLVRQVRKDVERLQATLEKLQLEQSDLLEVDPATVAANPEAAATLPPALLVRALVAANEENRALRKQLRKAREQRTRALGHARTLELAAAARDGRLATLEEVLAALHANLQDLRQQREFLREWAPARLGQPGALPPGERTP
jgi:DNA repair exonuclease SbcCD ATPase subunit